MTSHIETNAEIPESMTKSIADEMRGPWTDQPIRGVEHDKLNFSHYADVLTEVVLSTGTPITIGVFGPWGSGKTSLMWLVAEQLLHRRTEHHHWARVVWFNAWRYERDEGALWRALLLRVLDALENKQLSERDSQRIADWRARLYSDVQRTETGSLQVDWPMVGKGVLRLGFSMIPTPSTFPELAQMLAGKTETLEEIVSAFQRERIEVHRRQLTLLEEFQGGFAYLVREYIWRRNGLLVVFIDDLDRCLPERAVEVLEALKLFLDVPGCVFFIAADRDVIERVVRVQYAGYLVGPDEKKRDVPITGQNYLEKIVQLPFHLPPLEEEQIADFIDQHDHDLTPGCRNILALGLESNPRIVKRTLNIFRLLLTLAERRAGAGAIESVVPELLAKMVVIQVRYRDLYHDLLEYPNLIQDLEWAAREEEARGLAPLLAENETVDKPFTTLMERYLRYRPLLRMLRQEPTFSDLTRDQINAYIYLTRTTSEEAGRAPRMEAGRIWQDLLSNDPTRIQASVTVVRAEGTVDEYVKALARLLEPEADATPLKRISAGTALAYLGDPRDFDEMIEIPGGEFKYGEPGESLYVMAYCISRYPVTNLQYARFLADNPSYPVPRLDEDWARPYNWNLHQRTYPQGKANHPVVLVSWKDALAYCEWAGVRLPSEEEWEKAARGEDGRVYPWGDVFDPIWANVRESGIGSTTPVGAYPDGASPYGLLDCAGNVWEWTTSQAGAVSCDDSRHHTEGQVVIRGGSWSFRAEDARCFARDYSHPGHRSNRIGFRVVTGPLPQEEPEEEKREEGEGEETVDADLSTAPQPS
jgi:formylglycine-generating enzyme required for sulfatase activity